MPVRFTVNSTVCESDPCDAHQASAVFKGFFTNAIFVAIVAGTFVAQVIIVEFGGRAFSTTGLSWQQWLWCLALGFGSLLWNPLIHYAFPETWVPMVSNPCASIASDCSHALQALVHLGAKASTPIDLGDDDETAETYGSTPSITLTYLQQRANGTNAVGASP